MSSKQKIKNILKDIQKYDNDYLIDIEDNIDYLISRDSNTIKGVKVA